MLFESILDVVGGTPIVRLSRLCQGLPSSVYLKLEMLNPGGSHKVRIAINMIRGLEQQGELKRGDVILEATGGNTGKGIAMAAAVLGYKVLLVVPDNYSDRKVRQLEAFGAEVRRSKSETGLNSHGELAMEIQFENPDYVQLFQAKNPDNPDIHRKTTGPEIVTDLEHVAVDYFVGGFGTGGHLTGVGECLKARWPSLRVVAVQPEGCDFRTNQFSMHRLQGLAVGRVPENLNVSLIDEAISVSYEAARSTVLELLKTEGIGVGLSSGAILSAALTIARRSQKPCNIVCLAYDSMDDYLDEITPSRS